VISMMMIFLVMHQKITYGYQDSQ